MERGYRSRSIAGGLPVRGGTQVGLVRRLAGRAAHRAHATKQTRTAARDTGKIQTEADMRRAHYSRFPRPMGFVLQLQNPLAVLDSAHPTVLPVSPR
ncbi:hypothetical protein PRIPAC_77577 [Pristionchus pacificus]|uniref:Uncharacterized protein n=1 Tax=Pristionchus pacificus TaxID=54126 RepID=A0A2A6BX82_PRIPA|nr:hypothetical protein PRIPAC_77577 [Pristionchus pacificus]|eukprot:PDM70373.1 hypothetical protein PRIPAC_46619 [Pristionchus pacificus]